MCGCSSKQAALSLRDSCFVAEQIFNSRRPQLGFPTPQYTCSQQKAPRAGCTRDAPSSPREQQNQTILLDSRVVVASLSCCFGYIYISHAAREKKSGPHISMTSSKSHAPPLEGPKTQLAGVAAKHERIQSLMWRDTRGKNRTPLTDHAPHVAVDGVVVGGDAPFRQSAIFSGPASSTASCKKT